MGREGGLDFVDFCGDFGEKSGEGGFFFGGEATEDEVDVAEFLTEGVVPCAEAKAWKVGCVEGFGDGFEAVVAATTASHAIAKTVERQVEIVADDENVLEGNFVKIDKFGNGATGIVVESLRFDEDFVAVFEPNGMEFGFLPVEIFNFSIKIEGEKAEVVASEVVFGAGVAEADDEFHEGIIASFEAYSEVSRGPDSGLGGSTEELFWG